MSARDDFRRAFQTEMLHCIYFVATAARESDDSDRHNKVDEAAAYIGRAADVVFDEIERAAQHGGLP
jgi:hypothetical protein